MLTDKDKASIKDRIDRALNMLEEVCDTTCIVVTYYDRDSRTTYGVGDHRGNEYAVDESVKEWLDDRKGDRIEEKEE